jgi:hypothetical protein
MAVVVLLMQVLYKWVLAAAAAEDQWAQMAPVMQTAVTVAVDLLLTLAVALLCTPPEAEVVEVMAELTASEPQELVVTVVRIM